MGPDGRCGCGNMYEAGEGIVEFHGPSEPIYGHYGWTDDESHADIQEMIKQIEWSGGSEAEIDAMCEECALDHEAQSSGGKKFDSGKPPVSIIPWVALQLEAEVFAFGANKYGKFNFRDGFNQSRLIDACLRHILAYSWGEDIDPESGLNHLGHARCCLSMLLQNIEDGTSVDDRPEPMKGESDE